MKYNGKYSLRTYLMTESGDVNNHLLEEGMGEWLESIFSSDPSTLPDDDECIAGGAQFSLHHDDFYDLPVEFDKEEDCVSFKAGTSDKEKQRSMKQLQGMDFKRRKKTDEEMEEMRIAPYINNLNQKFERDKVELQKLDATKKVKTYRDLKLVLHALTLSEEELKRRERIAKMAGWAGTFTMIGLKIAKNILATMSGLDTITKWMGIVKDVGESILALRANKLQELPPKKAKTNPLSDALTLHPDYSKIIDPDLEEDMFFELISMLEDLEEEGKLDDPIPAEESSFTEYAESYIENEIGSKKTGLHGAAEAGDTAKLIDIKIPDLTKKQEEVFYAYLNIPKEVFANAHEIA